MIIDEHKLRKMLEIVNSSTIFASLTLHRSRKTRRRNKSFVIFAMQIKLRISYSQSLIMITKQNILYNPIDGLYILVTPITSCLRVFIKFLRTHNDRQSVRASGTFPFTRAMKHAGQAMLYKLANIKNRTCMQARLSRRLLSSTSFVTRMLSEKSFDPLRGRLREKKIRPSSSDPLRNSICICLRRNRKFLKLQEDHRERFLRISSDSGEN